MNKRPAIAPSLIFCLLLACCGTGASSGSADSTEPSGTGIEGYNMLEVSSETELSALSSSEVNKNYIIVKTVSGFDSGVFTDLGAVVDAHYYLGGAGFWHVKKEGGTVQLISDLQKTPGVYYAEHEMMRSEPAPVSASSDNKAAGPKDAAAIAAVFNDPYTWGWFPQFETTRALKAYSEIGFGPYTVYVVDIDTGINKTHEEFYDSDGNSIVVRAKSAFSASHVYVGDGNDFIDASDNLDDSAHGSHTAGTMVARGNNGKGVAGVCWKNAKLISYKCFDDSSGGSGSDWAIYGGIIDLVKWKEDNSIAQTIPVNMSLGGSYSSRYEIEMINYALSNGLVICAAAGNEGQRIMEYPAAYAGVIAVGAATSAGKRASFSNMGRHISVMGPGQNIYSTNNEGTNTYETMSGTSMAAPYVTGLAAYLLTFNPTLKADQIKALLEETAIDMGDSGYDVETGYGLVDVYAAAKRVSDGDVPEPGSVYSEGSAKITVVNTNASYSSGISGYEHVLAARPVYLYDSNGAYVSLAYTNTVNGEAVFQLLPPGSYTAKCYYSASGTSGSTDFVIGSSDVSATISFDVNVGL